ncbi:unnamed protein product [Leuciscus chuanchicus]
MSDVVPRELQRPWGATSVCQAYVSVGLVVVDCGGKDFSPSSPTPCEEEQHRMSSSSTVAAMTWGVWKKANTPKGDQIAVKRVSEMTPSTTRAGIKRPVTQEDREWARASLLQLGRFTGMGWILSPDSPNQDV